MQGTNRSRVGGEEPTICELRLWGRESAGYIYDFLGHTLMFPFERAMSNSKEPAEEPTIKCDTDKPRESVIVFEHIDICVYIIRSMWD